MEAAHLRICRDGTLSVILQVLQGGGTHICCVLRSLSAVKIKVKGQLEIFFKVNSQATISL